MHKLTARILDVSNAFKNTNFLFMKQFVSVHLPIILNGLEISYPNVPLNRDDDPFCLQCMNGIQGTKPDGRKWNRLLDAVVTIIEYKKITIDHAIYIKVFDDGTVSYLTVSTDDVLNTTNNENSFPELTILFKEHFEMKVK